MAHELKDTLNLPKTDFPMRASLAAREPQRVVAIRDDASIAKIEAIIQSIVAERLTLRPTVSEA